MSLSGQLQLHTLVNTGQWTHHSGTNYCYLPLMLDWPNRTINFWPIALGNDNLVIIDWTAPFPEPVADAKDELSKKR